MCCGGGEKGLCIGLGGWGWKGGCEMGLGGGGGGVKGCVVEVVKRDGGGGGECEKGLFVGGGG